MQASWCPELPVDNKGFCLWVCEAFWLCIWASFCKQQSRPLAVVEDLLRWMKPLETSKRRSVFQISLKQDPPLSSLLPPDLAWSLRSLQLAMSPVCSPPCLLYPEPGCVTLVSWNISNRWNFSTWLVWTQLAERVVACEAVLSDI